MDDDPQNDKDKKARVDKVAYDPDDIDLAMHMLAHSQTMRLAIQL